MQPDVSRPALFARLGMKRTATRKRPAMMDHVLKKMFRWQEDLSSTAVG